MQTKKNNEIKSDIRRQDNRIDEKNHRENENDIINKDNTRNGNKAQPEIESQETTPVRSLAEETNTENTVSDHIEFSTQISETNPVESPSSNSESRGRVLSPTVSENRSQKVSTTGTQTDRKTDTPAIEPQQAEEKTDQPPLEESPSFR